MKVIFVGVHNKAGLTPLDPISRSGKVISGIIKGLGAVECLRTNLFDTDLMPLNHEIKWKAKEYHHRVDVNMCDIIVLLGAVVHNNFENLMHNRIVKLPHPASTFYSGKKNEDYIANAIKKISELLTTKSPQ